MFMTSAEGKTIGHDIFDTSILIEYSRGNETIESKENYCFNSIVQMEFLVGARNKKELRYLQQMLCDFQLIETDQKILDLSVQLIEQYTLSHDMSVYDAIIATTCLVYDLPLWTLNIKDFRYIDDLQLFNKH